jgi:hypothetical protein
LSGKKNNIKAKAQLGHAFDNPSLKAGVTEYNSLKDFSPDTFPGQ